ncbi:MAG: cation-translocating P-type ATPase family protein, partial [Planctomycetes bacterium]|nr:cation-translocating P-type ATPase family protein [Planctomycetota bacterium]
IPVDGVVRDGRSAVDTSALTGETLPVEKGPGDNILAGSLNQFGALTVEARRVAEHTVVGRVIELTARALKDKASLERTADRLARYFLPAVLALAAVTFLVGTVLHMGGAGKRTFLEAARLSLDPTLAVLVVACPCALILATPAAIIAALGRLAGTGVLIKGGSSLERLAQVTAFAFDKTGTLTEGRLELGEIISLPGMTEDELLRMAASAEQGSEHPLARLILQEARQRGLSLEEVAEFRAHPGAGISARTRHESPVHLLVGTPRLLEEQAVPLSADVLALLDRLDCSGQTTLLVARDGVVLGALGARDRVRPEARAVVAELRTLGLEPIALLSGDRTAAAQAVAEAVGISDCHAELLPEEKAAFLEQWEQAGRRAAMVGDGINDAPALARADIGLAIGGTGTDVAAEAGDLVLMGDPLRPLPLLVRLSRATVKIIRQNILIFAFAVNAVGIVLTAWLWPLLTPAGWHDQAPLAAVVYHQIGSLAVLLNAMRLLWFERTTTSPGWRKLRHAAHTLDHWMERHLDPGEVLHWLEHHWKPTAGVAAVLLLTAYALSGLTRVGPDEVAVVRRFGRPLEPVLGPGLAWRWPWPVEQVSKVKPDHVYTVEIGFRSGGDNAGNLSPLAWSSAHNGQNMVPDEAVMVTGDGNLVEVQAVVRYRLNRRRLATYLFEVRDPDALVRAAAESVLREDVAARKFNALATTGREQLQRELLDHLQTRCGEYGPHGSWVHLEGLSLLDLHPPQDVVPAYHEVIMAMQERDRQINQAEAQAKRKISEAAVKARSIIVQAEAARTEKILLAQALRDAFLARRRARTQLTWLDRWPLITEAAAAVHQGQAPSRVYQDYERRCRELAAQRAVLNDFRLFWDALSGALKGRDTFIIDADQVPGRRHLFLFDLNQVRVPLPGMVPQEKE